MKEEDKNISPPGFDVIFDQEQRNRSFGEENNTISFYDEIGN